MIILVQLQVFKPLNYARKYDVILAEEGKLYLSISDIIGYKQVIIEEVFKDERITEEEWIKAIAYIISVESDEDILRMITLKVHLNINRLFTKDTIVRQECAETMLCVIEMAPDELILQDVIEKVSLLDFNLFKQLYNNLTITKNYKNKSLKNIAAGILLRHSIILALNIDDTNDDQALLLLNKLLFILNVEPCPLILTSALQAIKVLLQFKQDICFGINWQRPEEILKVAESNENKDLRIAIIELKELASR